MAVPHDDFIEVRMSGVLDGLGAFTAEEWELVQRVRKVLYNFDEVEAVTFEPWSMAGHIQHMADRGISLAGYAERPVWFGVSRQLELMADSSAGAIRSFKDRASACEWLRGR